MRPRAGTRAGLRTRAIAVSAATTRADEPALARPARRRRASERRRCPNTLRDSGFSTYSSQPAA